MKLKSKRVLRHSCAWTRAQDSATVLPQRALLAYGRAGEGHIVIHSRKERRYRCNRCGRTFSATKGTTLYRAHKPHELVAAIVALLACGCPVQAIVAAFSLDERTVARWQSESGRQCRRVHKHIVQAGGVLLAHVQADELRIRIVGGVVWLASALSVSSSLWLGGVVQPRRERLVIRRLLEGVLVRCSRPCCSAPMNCPVTPRAGFDGLLRTSSHRQARSSSASFAGGAHGRPGGQEVRPPTGGRGPSARRSRHGSCSGSLAQSHARQCHGGHQHRLHREVAGHLPLAAGSSGAQDAGGCSSEADTQSGSVVGGHRVQLLPGASVSEIPI